jgi:predicted permease
MRGLRKNPGYAAVFAVTLGLGIGANTAMFSAVNSVLLRPLPHHDGERLVYLRHRAALAGIDNVLFSVPEIDDYRRTVPSFEGVSEFSALTFTLLGLDAPLRVRAGIVTGNYFEVLGLSETRGRLIGPEDDGEAAPAVIVLSDAYWRARFGADPDIVGRTFRVNGRTATVVGVVEPAPPYPEHTDIYVNMVTSPHHLEATMQTDRRHRMTEVFAKLGPGATVESARTEVGAITERLHDENPEAYDRGSGYEVTVTPLKTQITQRARSTFLLLLGTAFFVLVIACANLANLTLSRVLRRDHELAIRVSLGGSRGALRRELLAESLLLSAAGAALGLMMASVSLGLLVRFAERHTSRASEIALDGSVFGFALLAAVAASLFFSLIPPLPDSDTVSGALTRSGARSTVGSGGRRAQRALVVAQIGTSFVLLIGAGLLLRTTIHLNRIDPGFDTQQVLTFDVPVDFEVMAQDPMRVRNMYVSVLDSLRALPGVVQAALTSSVPLQGEGIFTIRPPVDVENDEPPLDGPTPRAELVVVSPAYFETLGIELLRGRTFTTTDTYDAQKVVVINESMARALFGDRDPIGQRMAWVDPLLEMYLGVEPEMRTIVGVVEDTRHYGIGHDVGHMAYNPFDQINLTGSYVVRVAGDAEAIVPSVRRIVQVHDSDQPIANVATLEDLGSESVAPQRLNAILLSVFAILALVIAAVGIAGVLAFSVGSRTREFGIMSALGAAQHQVWSGVLAEGAAMAGAGIVLGSVAAAGLARFIAGLLVGVPALDPVTFLAVGLLLAGVAVIASWIPAWRAASVSPIEALTAE